MEGIWETSKKLLKSKERKKVTEEQWEKQFIALDQNIKNYNDDDDDDDGDDALFSW